tara:strand:+ start:490 stop:609 length:120 start_codon:yes stop_codon:yes gene_type:complete
MFDKKIGVSLSFAFINAAFHYLIITAISGEFCGQEKSFS